MIWIPVTLSLLLGPGMGQIYNREYRKGAYLVIVSMVVLLAAIHWLKNLIVPYMPADFASEDPFVLAQRIQGSAQDALRANSGVVLGYQLILSGLWIYSVVDAYRGGKRRARAQKLPAPPALKKGPQ